MARITFFLGAIATCCVACSAKSPPCPRPAEPEPRTTAAPVAEVRPLRVNILIDGSGSMAGYFSTSQSGNHYRDLLHQLRDDLRDLWGDALEVQFSRFGRKITPLTPQDEIQMTTRDFYTRRCSAAQRDGCDVEQSVIGRALATAEKSPDNELTLVFTDLFLTDDDLLPGGVSSLKDPLYRVLNHGGRSIGLLGFETPFQGPIYDLPNQPVYLHKPASADAPQTTRPVFVLIIGRARHVLALHKALHGPFLSDLGEHQRFVFYSADWAGSPQSLTWAEAKGIRSDSSSSQLARVEYRVRARGYEPLSAKMTHQNFQALYGNSFGHFITRESLWTEHGKPGCPSREPFGGVGTLAAAQVSADGVEVRIFVDPRQVQHLPSPNVYSLDVDVVADTTATAAQGGNLDEWNLDPTDVPRFVRSRPRFFPTLNLKTLTDFLDRRARESFQPLVVAHATVTFRVEK
jgi:hypothetical protein